MFRRSDSLCVRLTGAVAAIALLLAPPSAVAEAALVAGRGSASASLDFRIIIPAIMRVVENSHPVRIDGSEPVEQRLVVLSNMKHGFCANLRPSDPRLQGWQMTADATAGVTLQAMADGYRLCAHRPGRYTLRLQHDFGPQSHALAWPIHTELMAL